MSWSKIFATIGFGREGSPFWEGHNYYSAKQAKRYFRNLPEYGAPNRLLELDFSTDPPTCRWADDIIKGDK